MASGTHQTDGRFWHPLRIAGWGGAAFLLLLPLLAMQFTEEVDWAPFDFLLMGILMLGVGLPLEAAVRLNPSTAYRAGAALALLAGFLLVWVNLAVGIIGEPDNPPNLMYFGVLAVGAAGALTARFQPRGMARAMFLAAGLLVAMAVFVVGMGLRTEPWADWPVIAAFNGFFAALFGGAALLFAEAGRERSPRSGA